MRKVFEIKVASSASFYSYLALSGIDFKTKEKPDVIIFTCDMTDEEQYEYFMNECAMDDTELEFFGLLKGDDE